MLRSADAPVWRERRPKLNAPSPAPHVLRTGLIQSLKQQSRERELWQVSESNWTTKAGPALELLFAPLREKNFKRLILFLASWNFAANLAAPFFTVYMLRSLNYPITTILALTIASQLSNIAALGLWGALIDRFSNKSVLGVAAPLFLACTLAWTFTGVPWVEPYTLYLLAVIHILMGVATAGVGLASGNIAMKLSPPGQATAYLAAEITPLAAAAATAPILGGLTVQLPNLHSWTFFFRDGLRTWALLASSPFVCGRTVWRDQAVGLLGCHVRSPPIGSQLVKRRGPATCGSFAAVAVVDLRAIPVIDRLAHECTSRAILQQVVNTEQQTRSETILTNAWPTEAI